MTLGEMAQAWIAAHKATRAAKTEMDRASAAYTAADKVEYNLYGEIGKFIEQQGDDQELPMAFPFNRDGASVPSLATADEVAVISLHESQVIIETAAVVRGDNA